MSRLSVSEYFYSLQGEGKTMGRPAVFIRLAGCNLLCGGEGTEKDKKLHDGATWRCDTIEVWRKGKAWKVGDLMQELHRECNYPALMKKGIQTVITGGEPLLQQPGIVEFLTLLREDMNIKTGQIEIETNGTKIPTRAVDLLVDQYNVSFKMKNSGMPNYETAIIPAIAFFRESHKAIFKFVVISLSDMIEVVEFCEKHSLPASRVWLMPAASSTSELLRRNQQIAEFCIKNNYNFSTRLQVEIWDKTTGV